MILTIRTVYPSHNSIPIVLNGSGSVEREAESVARVGDNAADNGTLLVGVRPKVDFLAPNRLSKDSDLLRVTTKRSNVIMNPFDSNSLIAETEVGRLAWGSREAEDVNSVVNSNNDDVLRARKILAVVESSVSASIVESYLQSVLYFLIPPLRLVNESMLTSSKEED